MEPLTDIYVLALERTVRLVTDFLDALLPDREQSAAEYCIPELSTSPAVVLDDAMGAISYCCEHSNMTLAVYFRSLRATAPSHAMVFFTRDSMMILGISTPITLEDSAEHSAETAGWLLRLKNVTSALSGFALIESPPPRDTARNFLYGLECAAYPKMVAGRVKLS